MVQYNTIIRTKAPSESTELFITVNACVRPIIDQFYVLEPQ
jgi:hypothetical protein